MYSSDLYQKALNRLDRRREEDELRTAATLAEVSAKVPRLEEIQNQHRTLWPTTISAPPARTPAM